MMRRIGRQYGRGDMIATLEAVLYWLVSSVAAAFIGLAVVAPERVDGHPD
jgi:hypothetical protein